MPISSAYHLAVEYVSTVPPVLPALVGVLAIALVAQTISLARQRATSVDSPRELETRDQKWI